MLSSSVKQTALRGVINGDNVKKSISKFYMYLLLCNFQRLCRENLKFIIRHCGGVRAFIELVVNPQDSKWETNSVINAFPSLSFFLSFLVVKETKEGEQRVV